MASQGPLHSIRANFNAQEFADKRDRVKLRAVADALATDLWMQRFSFVLMYSKWLGFALRWRRIVPLPPSTVLGQRGRAMLDEGQVLSCVVEREEITVGLGSNGRIMLAEL